MKNKTVLDEFYDASWKDMVGVNGFEDFQITLCRLE